MRDQRTAHARHGKKVSCAHGALARRSVGGGRLADKFNLSTVTTNYPASRADPQKFWNESPGIVASLHTLKQPAQLEIARQIKWDILVVDEAHYLRNRESQAWQAINVLPRQFLLLLTATPMQNSLEELYNLVTLLQPGQLPSPKDSAPAFWDPNVRASRANRRNCGDFSPK